MPEILFPILTGLTLVFAGILVGYFLWFRDRQEQMILSQQLSTENERLKLELQGSRSQHGESEEQLGRLELKNTSLQQLCDDLLKSREKVQMHASDLESELDSNRAKLDETREQLTAECRKRTQVEESFLAAKQQFLDSKSAEENKWQSKNNELQAACNRAATELKQQLSVNRQLEGRVHQLTTTQAEIESEMASQNEMLETAKKNALGLEKEYVSLETSLRSQHDLLKESRGQAAAALSAKGMAETALAESQQTISRLNERIEELEAETNSSQKLKDRCEHLEASLQLSKERIEAIVAQRDEFGSKHQAAERELTGLRNRTQNQQKTIAMLRASASDIDQQRQQDQQDLSAQIKALEETNSNIQSNLARLASRNKELEALNASLESNNTDLQFQHDNLTKTIVESNQLHVEATENLNRLSVENSQLATRMEELEQTERQTSVASEEVKIRLESLLQQRDQALGENNEIKEKMKRMQTQARSNEETIRNLRRERGAILMRNRAYANSSFPRIHNESLEFSKADQLSAEYGGTIQSDPVRGPVFVEPPRQKDDLKLIYGVAKVLEEKLNEFGIYTFKQIMEWDKKTIKEFSELLVFKDRIERDDWIGQATKLYQQKSKQQVA